MPTRFLARHRAADTPLVVLDIPLLFETGGTGRVDKIAVVTAPAEMQRERVLSRPGMTPKSSKPSWPGRHPMPEKRRRADFVIDTGAGIEAARATGPRDHPRTDGKSPANSLSEHACLAAILRRAE